MEQTRMSIPCEKRIASCSCGRLAFTLAGKPIVRTVCYCKSCRTAGHAFEAAGAPHMVGADGGTDLVLYRKDRVALVHGAGLLREHRLKPESRTRRMLATCCNTPVFLEFTRGHWISFYTDRFSDVPPLEMRVMIGDRPDGAPLPGDVSNIANHSGKFMRKILVSWVAMGFRNPKLAF